MSLRGCFGWLFLGVLILLGLVTLEDCTPYGATISMNDTGERYILSVFSYTVSTPTPFPNFALEEPDAPSVAIYEAPPSIGGDLVPIRGMDCTGMHPTSPTDGIAYQPTTFYWDAPTNLAPDGVTYTVLVFDYASGGVIASGSTDAPNTNLTLNMGDALQAFSNQFVPLLSWQVVASRGETQCSAYANGGAPIAVDFRGSPYENSGGGGSSEEPSEGGYTPPDDDYEPPDGY